MNRLQGQDSAKPGEKDRKVLLRNADTCVCDTTSSRATAIYALAVDGTGHGRFYQGTGIQDAGLKRRAASALSAEATVTRLREHLSGVRAGRGPKPPPPTP